jgi:hypothetical protein
MVALVNRQWNVQFRCYEQSASQNALVFILPDRRTCRERTIRRIVRYLEQSGSLNRVTVTQEPAVMILPPHLFTHSRTVEGYTHCRNQPSERTSRSSRFRSASSTTLNDLHHQETSEFECSPVDTEDERTWDSMELRVIDSLAYRSDD